MNGVYLCKCNNCETVMVDENPQVNARKHNTYNVDVKAMLFDSNNLCWVCPVCNTDDFLIDL